MGLASIYELVATQPTYLPTYLPDFNQNISLTCANFYHAVFINLNLLTDFCTVKTVLFADFLAFKV